LIVAAFHGLGFEIEELSMPKVDRSLVAHLQSTARVIAARDDDRARSVDATGLSCLVQVELSRGR
jgi:hypothetical protein